MGSKFYYSFVVTIEESERPESKNRYSKFHSAILKRLGNYSSVVLPLYITE